jgi:uncharacterized protein (TIRG00374 family)
MSNDHSPIPKTFGFTMKTDSNSTAEPMWKGNELILGCAGEGGVRGESSVIIRGMRKLVIALVLMVGIMFVLTQLAEIEDIVHTLQQGDWRFLVLAFLVEMVWLVNIGTSFHSIYRILGVDEKLGRLILMASAANFINIVAPSAGIGGIAVFISEARDKEYSAGRVTVASTLFVLFDYIGFLFILVLGFLVLIRRDQLTVSEIVAAIIIVLVAIALATLLYLGVRSEQKLARILSWLAGGINKIVRPFRGHRKSDYLPKERAYTFAHEIAAGLKEIHANTRDLVYPVLLAINSKVLVILVLYCVFLAFNVPASIGTLIAGYCVAYLFTIVSPTPSGIGIVEGVMTLALRSFFIPLGTAAVLTLAYRAFTFWLPLLVGMGAFRLLGLSRGKDEKLAV